MQMLDRDGSLIREDAPPQHPVAVPVGDHRKAGAGLAPHVWLKRLTRFMCVILRALHRNDG
jgi:hypothetical protein